MDRFQNFKVEGLYYSFVQMDKWIEKSKYLMALCQDNNVIIDKFYWRSKIDSDYLELIEPKVVDAFYMHVDIHGKEEDVKTVLEQYNKVRKMLEEITVVTPLTENEIQDLAQKIVNQI